MLTTVAMLLMFLWSAVMCIREPRNRRWEGLFLISLCVFPVRIGVPDIVSRLTRYAPYKYDQYVFYLDRPFGQPSFLVGRLLSHHQWLNTACGGAYDFLTFPLVCVIGIYFLFMPVEDAFHAVRSISLCLFLSVPIYFAIPVAGPRYAFGAFPNDVPLAFPPHPVLIAAAPNGIPSVHLACALIVLYFLSRWKLGFALSLIFTMLTILATLGKGEHYLFDLIVAVPYAALVIYLGGYKRRAGVFRPVLKALPHLDNRAASD